MNKLYPHHSLTTQEENGLRGTLLRRGSTTVSGAVPEHSVLVESLPLGRYEAK